MTTNGIIGIGPLALAASGLVATLVGAIVMLRRR